MPLAKQAVAVRLGSNSGSLYTSDSEEEEEEAASGQGRRMRSAVVEASLELAKMKKR